MADTRPVMYLSHRDLAVELNNAGCALLEANHLLAGTGDVLRDALAALGEPPVPVDASDPHDANLEEYVSYRAEAWGRAQEIIDEASVTTTSTNEKKAPPPPLPKRYGDARVYAEPLRLEPLGDNWQDSREDLGLETTSAVVLFNLSLAHHLAGERTGCATYIDSAVEFYKLTETMVQRAVRRTSSSDGDDPSGAAARRHLSTVVKGILNNMGQICMAWNGDPHMGLEYFAELRARLLSTPSLSAAAGGGERERRSVRRRAAMGEEGGMAMDPFRFNAFVVKGSIHVPSAA